MQYLKTDRIGNETKQTDFMINFFAVPIIDFYL